MEIKPVYRAILAAGYIALLVLGMNWITRTIPGPDTLLVPIALLSLFVLSVALMAFLFFVEPATQLINGDAKGALRFFLATVGWFAVAVVLFLSVALLIR